MRIRRSIRRAFTLIETMMAALLGGLLALACMAMFGAMGRTESATARRFSETASMARLHLVMNRVLGDLLIQGVDSGPAQASATTGRNTATSDFQAADRARNGQVQAQPRPRILLESDATPLMKAAIKTAGLDLAGATPQRLEVVTSHSPIPQNFASASVMELHDALDQAGVMASRGAFELRPDAVTPRERMDPGEQLSGDGKGWTLWWRPLPPTDGLLQPDPYSLDPTQDPNSVRVAVGLVQCNWTVFKTVMDTATNKPKGREQLTELSASMLQDLPAYAEMHATTASGLTANWMFEIGWSNGPETTDEAQQDGTATAGAGGPGGGPGGAVQSIRGGPGLQATTVVGRDGNTITTFPGGRGGRGGPGGPGDPMFKPGNGGPNPGIKPGGGGRRGG